MTQHTKGDHLKPEMRASAGSWCGDTCYCDRVQTLNISAVGATGTGQTWMTANDYWIIPYVQPATVPYTWPNLTITYPDPGLSEKVKILEEKVRELEKRAIVDDATKAMMDAISKWKLVNKLLEVTGDSPKTGTAKTRPINETEKEES